MEESEKFNPNLMGAIPHEEWVKRLKKNLDKHSTSIEDLELYFNDRDEYERRYRQEYERKYGFAPGRIRSLVLTAGRISRCSNMSLTLGTMTML